MNCVFALLELRHQIFIVYKVIYVT